MRVSLALVRARLECGEAGVIPSKLRTIVQTVHSMGMDIMGVCAFVTVLFEPISTVRLIGVLPIG